MKADEVVSRLEAIRVERSGRTLLELPSLALRRGEVLGLLGRNGAGKSTLLRVMAGLERPDRGQAWLFGTALRYDDRDLPVRRRAATVLQRTLLTTGSVLENVALGLRIRGSTDRREAEAWMERLGIAALGSRAVAELSGGEARRVVLARALATAPELLFLDEPFSGLDRPSRDELLEVLPSMLRSTGATLVLVSHDRTELQGWATRLVLLEQGRVLEEGPADRLWIEARTPEGRRLVGRAPL